MNLALEILGVWLAISLVTSLFVGQCIRVGGSRELPVA